MTVESIILQRATVTTVACPTSDFMTFNTLHHICAGRADNSSGPVVGICTIDVGGPLVDGTMLFAIPFFHDPRFCGRSPVRFDVI